MPMLPGNLPAAAPSAARHRLMPGAAGLALAGAIAILLALVLHQGLRLAGVASAFTAKHLCSEVFVAGREAQAVAREDLPAFRSRILGWVDWRLEDQSVQAHILGIGRRVAAYRSGLGCSLALEGPPAPLPVDVPATSGTSFDFPPAATPPSALERVVDAAFQEPDPLHPRRTRALLVLHHGRLLVERYAPGFDATTRFAGWSMSKSVLNALVGILVGDGRLYLEAPAPVAAWAAPGDPRRDITLDQLLRMSSGLRFDEDYDDPLSDVVRMLYDRRDSAAFAAARPLAHPPGRRFAYATGTSAILSRIVAEVAAEPWPRFARHRLFAPLGMDSALIEPDPAGTPQLASYVWATARDWARFGLLYLQDGVWAGRRILPAGWVAYSRSPAPADPKGEYGAHFWLRVPPPIGWSRAAPIWCLQMPSTPPATARST